MPDNLMRPLVRAVVTLCYTTAIRQIAESSKILVGVERFFPLLTENMEVDINVCAPVAEK